MIKLNTHKLQLELIEQLKDTSESLKPLNTKQDLIYNSVKGNKSFLQYGGVDYKGGRRAVVKFVIYVVNKKLFNDDDSISKELDELRYAIIDLDTSKLTSAFLVRDDETNSIINILEEKYNNTDTLEFIYSIVIGVNVLI